MFFRCLLLSLHFGTFFEALTLTIVLLSFRAIDSHLPVVPGVSACLSSKTKINILLEGSAPNLASGLHVAMSSSLFPFYVQCQEFSRVIKNDSMVLPPTFDLLVRLLS